MATSVLRCHLRSWHLASPVSPLGQVRLLLLVAHALVRFMAYGTRVCCSGSVVGLLSCLVSGVGGCIRLLLKRTGWLLSVPGVVILLLVLTGLPVRDLLVPVRVLVAVDLALFRVWVRSFGRGRGWSWGLRGRLR